MKNISITKLVNKVLNETLEEKAQKITNNLKNKEVSEDMGGMEDEHPVFGRMTPEDLKKYTQELMKKYDLDPETEQEDNDDEEFPDFVETFESEVEEGEMCSECGGTGMMNEVECNECGGSGKMYQEEGLYDVAKKFPKKQSFDYVQETDDIETDDFEDEYEDSEEGENYETCQYYMNNFGADDEYTKKYCIGFNIPELGLDKHMFSMNESSKVRQMKSKTKNTKKPDFLDLDNDGDKEEPMKSAAKSAKKKKTQTDEGNAFTKKLKDTPKGGTFELGGKKYKDNSELEEKDCMECGSKYPVVEKWEGDVEVEHTGEHSSKSIEEINSEIKKLKSKSESYKSKGQKVPKNIREKMSELYFAKRAKQGWKGKGKAKVKESFQLTENELIGLIQNIVEAESKKQGKNIKTVGNPPGLKKYEQSHKASGKENSDYLKSVTKKMTEYLKDASKGKYETNPDIFPKGNGELAKMSKKAYIPSDAVKDYTENLTAAGLENLDYDEIHPNEEWVENNVVGSSKTGNNPEWANTGKSDVNKKRNEVRKKNMLAKIKRKAYNKAPQPVLNDKTGEDEGSKILMKLESKEEKKIAEEFNRMKQLISYEKKTQ